MELNHTNKIQKVLTLEGELYSSKNSKQIVRSKKTGKSFIVDSKASQKGKKWLKPQLIDEKNKEIWRAAIKKVKKFPIHLGLYVERKTLAKWDFNNISQGLMDELVDADYFIDDNVSVVVPVYLGSHKSSTPQVHIYIIPDDLVDNFINLFDIPEQGKRKIVRNIITLEQKEEFLLSKGF